MTLTEDLAQHGRDLDRLKQLQAMIDDHLIDNAGELVIRAGPSQIELTAQGITLVHGQNRIDLAQLSNMFLMYQWLLESQVIPPGILAQVTNNPELYQGQLENSQQTEPPLNVVEQDEPEAEDTQ